MHSEGGSAVTVIYLFIFFILCLESSNLHQKWNMEIISLILICFWTYTTHAHLKFIDAAPFILWEKKIRKRSPPSDNCHLGIGQFRPMPISNNLVPRALFPGFGGGAGKAPWGRGWISKLILLVCRLQSSSKVLGRLPFLPLLFLPPPAPGPMLIKTLMFVHVIVLLYPNIEQGERGIFRKRENSLFSGLKWTTVKLYSLPNYFCLWL